MNVREAKAGHELDAACAEALGMEFDILKSWKHKGQRGTWVYCTSFGVYDPSIDIAVAWELVEAMREADIDFSLNCMDFFDYRWQASYSITGAWHTVEADTAPLAICRTFLLANGITEVNNEND